MLRFAFVALGVVAVLGFLLSGPLQTAAESRFPKVQWVEHGTPVGDVERASIEGLPRLKGSGPEGSVFIERNYRNQSLPFAHQAQIYVFARLGCLAAFLTALAGFFIHRNIERLARIEKGEAPG